MLAKYRYNGKKCNRKVLPSSNKGFCILHEDWNLKSEEETRREFYKEIEEEIRDFRGCILPEVDLSERILKGDINFDEATIEGNVIFDGATIEGDVRFNRARIKKRFGYATIGGNAYFEAVKKMEMLFSIEQQ